MSLRSLLRYIWKRQGLVVLHGVKMTSGHAFLLSPTNLEEERPNTTQNGNMTSVSHDSFVAVGASQIDFWLLERHLQCPEDGAEARP
eukprot:2834020-Amphidinium_carterae.1